MSVLPLARQLGEKLHIRGDIDKPEPIQRRVQRCTRQDAWPPEVWAEMQAIYRGERD